MATTTDQPSVPTDLIGGDGMRAMTLELGPDGLDAFLDAVKRYPGRLVYREGRLTLVSPSYSHEHEHGRLADIVEAICDEFDIDYTRASSTLYRRRDLDHGIEPDQSYYIEHAGAIDDVRGNVDTSRYPPPDLVIEAVWSHPANDALEILRAMGTPEVWHYVIPKHSLRFLHLVADGRYEARESSRSFPFLFVNDVLDRLRSAPEHEPHNRWKRRLRDWVRDELGPRRAGR